MIITDIDKFIKNNNITSIFLDIDGTLWHTCQACVEIINKMQGTDFTGADVTDWDFKSVCPTITYKEVEDMFVTDNFFQRVKWIDGALEFIKRHKDKIIIVTHARTENFMLKKLFFEQYGLEDIPIIPIPLELSKGIINMNYWIDFGNSLFIDDSANNLYSSNADYKIQFKEYNDGKIRHWQEDWVGAVMYKY